MCPFLFLLAFLWIFVVDSISAFKVTFTPSSVTFKEDDLRRVTFSVVDPSMEPTYLEDGIGWKTYDLQISDTSIASISGPKNVSIRTDDPNGSFNITGIFLGRTTLFLVDKKDGRQDKSSDALDIIVTRKQTLLSTIFTVSVIIIVSINYINMGCALDLDVIKDVLRRPIAPIVGFMTQFLVMPITSYFVGLWLLGDFVHLRLGLFIFGASPAGGASNMWTVLLNGNLDLSITMTFISTLAACAMLPLWMSTLGRKVYSGTTTAVPVQNIFSTLISMVVCLGIGLAIQKWLPKVAAFARKILAPVCVVLIIFIVTFGTYANLYLFKLINFTILMSAGLTVWTGFAAGYVFARLLRLPSADRVAICVETGIQNTGIAIVLLGLSLPPPDNDISIIVPVAASIVTPIPLTIAWICLKCWSRFHRTSKDGKMDGGYQSVRPVSYSSNLLTNAESSRVA